MKWTAAATPFAYFIAAGQGRRLVNGCAQAGRRQPWAVARGGGELPTDAWGPPPLARLAARTAAEQPPTPTSSRPAAVGCLLPHALVSKDYVDGDTIFISNLG